MKCSSSAEMLMIEMQSESNIGGSKSGPAHKEILASTADKRVSQD